MREKSYAILLLTFTLAACAPASVNNPPVGDPPARGGDLFCFSIARPEDGAAKQSCDQLCAAKNAACVSLKMDGAFNPGFDCADALDPLRGGDVVAACRCCKAGP